MSLKVAVVQGRVHPDAEENLRQARKNLDHAARLGAKLVLLPELFNQPYFCQTQNPDHFQRAEPIPGPTSQALGCLAAEREMVIVTSLFERRARGRYHNTAVVLERDGRLAGTYRKMHIPQDPGYEEKYYFRPGHQGFRPIDTSVGRLGVLICWDQWFPEAARLMALAGAQILLYPSAIGWDPGDPAEEQQRQQDAWRLVQQGHAVANQLPLLSANRIGLEPGPGDGQGGGIPFWGHSFICGPQGELLAGPANAQPALLHTELDLERSEDLARLWPFFRDRRTDAYGPLNDAEDQ